MWNRVENVELNILDAIRHFWGSGLENKAFPAPEPAKFVKTHAEFLNSGQSSLRAI